LNVREWSLEAKGREKNVAVDGILTEAKTAATVGAV